MKPMIEHPIIAAPPALVMQPMKLPNTNPPDFGNPNGPKVAGPGSAAAAVAAASARATAADSALGTGGNCCGGVYQVGGGVSAPVGIYGPEAEFSDEARRAKYQGEVDVRVIVGADGLVKYAHVITRSGHGAWRRRPWRR